MLKKLGVNSSMETCFTWKTFLSYFKIDLLCNLKVATKIIPYSKTV